MVSDPPGFGDCILPREARKRFGSHVVAALLTYLHAPDWPEDSEIPVHMLENMKAAIQAAQRTKH